VAAAPKINAVEAEQEEVDLASTSKRQLTNFVALEARKS